MNNDYLQMFNFQDIILTNIYQKLYRYDNIFRDIKFRLVINRISLTHHYFSKMIEIAYDVFKIIMKEVYKIGKS